MLFAAVERLPTTSYTHINNGSLSKSWLDHCLVSSTVNTAIDSVNIIYEDYLSDHLPLTVNLKINKLPVQTDSFERSPKIKWDFENSDKNNAFFRAIEINLISQPHRLLCDGSSCDENDHNNLLETMWNDFIRTVSSNAQAIFGTESSRRYVVPGWNNYVREHYAASREAFHAWRRDNSPRQGASADYMRRCRARFKLALRQCRELEHEARASALANKFANKNIRGFWNDIKSLNRKRPKLPTTIDGVTGASDICYVWKNKFETLLNRLDDEACAQELRHSLQSMDNTPVLMVTTDELISITKCMASGKSMGKDNIPLEFYKNAPPFILTWLCNFFNAILIHGFIPQTITEVILTPLLKSSLKDPCSSGNYRPIAQATAASKILEYIILNRLEGFLDTTDYQLGFKKGHGTDVGIFILKDLVNYYKKLNTPTFLCFLDIKSCFDLISYKMLLCILCNRGAPKYVITLLINWYL